jgi:hypothetical protein
MSHPSCCSLYQEEFTFVEHPRKPTIQNAWFGSNSDIQGRLCDGLDSNIVMQFSVGLITLHGQISARKYMDRLGNQVHPMIQTLFTNNSKTTMPPFT